jgi:hypothetical protein
MAVLPKGAESPDNISEVVRVLGRVSRTRKPIKLRVRGDQTNLKRAKKDTI